MLEFKQEENGRELFIDAHSKQGDKGLWFLFRDANGNDTPFGIIQDEELIELASFLNLRIGYELMNIENIKKASQ